MSNDLAQIKEQLLGQLDEWREEQRERLKRYQNENRSDSKEIKASVSDVKDRVVCLEAKIGTVETIQLEQKEKIDRVHETMHGNGNPAGGCVAKSQANFAILKTEVDTQWRAIKWIMGLLSAAGVAVLTWWLAAGSPVP